MPTISNFRKAYDVQPNTIRQWSRTFAEFLTPGANPGKGVTRTYTDDDGSVIALVAAMRKDNRPYEEIRAALADGDRGQWPIETEQPQQDAPGSQDNRFALVTQLTAKAASLEGEIGAVKEERDHLRSELKEAQDARLVAESGRSAAEAKLEVLEALDAENKAQVAKSPGFWARIFGKRE